MCLSSFVAWLCVVTALFLCMWPVFVVSWLCFLKTSFDLIRLVFCFFNCLTHLIIRFSRWLRKCLQGQLFFKLQWVFCLWSSLSDLWFCQDMFLTTWGIIFTFIFIYKLMYKLMSNMLVAQTERWLSANHGLSLCSLTNDRHASWHGTAFSFHDASTAGALCSPCIHGWIIAAPRVVRVQNSWWENILLQQPYTGVHLGETTVPGGER